jgi:hypothetical protein
VTSALLVSPSIAAASPPDVDWQNYPGENGYAAHRPACVAILDAVRGLPVEMLGVRFDGRHHTDPAKGVRVGRAGVDRFDVEVVPVPAMVVDRDSRVVQRIEHEISSAGENGSPGWVVPPAEVSMGISSLPGEGRSPVAAEDVTCPVAAHERKMPA